MAKEVSQAGTRPGVNPSLMIVWTSDTTSDIAMAMITGTSSRAYLGSTRRVVTLDSSGWAGCMSLAPFGRRLRSRISVDLPPWPVHTTITLGHRRQWLSRYCRGL